MNNEDLLTTNSINNSGFTEYTNALSNSNNIYDSNKPEFFKESVSQPNLSNIDETSVGYDQFKNLEELSGKKRKKIVRSVINIDSKNRKKLYSFNEQKIKIDNKVQNNIIFYNSQETFYLICEDTVINDINDYREIILKDVDSSLENLLGVNNTLLEFDESSGSPILFVKNFIYNTKTINQPGYKDPNDYSNKINYFNSNIGKYEFNIIEVLLPSKINPNEINDLSTRDVFISSFISNVSISYTSPSHYKVSLNRTYSNIYAVRLVSSEIPNTAYSFNGIEITTNLGRNKLSTRINNRLRWINFDDKHTFCSYDLNEYKLYSQSNPVYNDISEITSIQIEQNEINKDNFNLNIHPLKIYACSYENISIKNLNKKNNTVDGYFSFDSNKGENIYFIENYDDYQIKVNEFKNSLTYLYENDKIVNTIYLDNEQLIDNLSLTLDDATKTDFDNRSSKINGKEFIILPQQNENIENNIYLTNTHLLTCFHISNQGSGYDSNKMIPSFYYFDTNYKKYIKLISGKDYEGNDINLTSNINLNFENGSYTNITFNTDIYLYSDLYKTKKFYKDYYFGNRGYLLNYSLIENTSTSTLYKSTDLYSIKNVYFDNVRIVNEYGDFDVDNIINNLTSDQVIFCIKNILGSFGEANLEHYFNKPNGYEYLDLNLPLLLDNNNYYLDSTLSFNDLKKRILDNVGPDVFSQINLITEDSLLSENANKDKLISFLNRARYTISANKQTDFFNLDLFNAMKNDISISRKFNDYVNIRIFDLSSNLLKMISGDTVNIDFDYNVFEANTKFNIKYTMDIYIIDALLRFKEYNDNASPEILSENLFRASVCLGTQLESIINTQNEVSRNITESSSYLAYRYLEDTYNYIYNISYGLKANNKYFLIKKINNRYNFSLINISKNFNRHNLYLRQNLSKTNSIIPLEKRDYYNNFDLIGRPNEFGLDQSDLKIYKNASVMLLDNIYSKVKYELQSFNQFEAYINAGNLPRSSYTYITFKSNFELLLSLFSAIDSNGNLTSYYDDSLLKNLFHNKELPIRISIYSIEEVKFYSFYIFKISKVENNKTTGRHVITYRFNLEPISGDFEKSARYVPFKTAVNTDKVIVLIHNPITYNEINNLKKNYPDYLEYFTKYYSKTVVDYYNKSENFVKPGDNITTSYTNSIILKKYTVYNSSSTNSLTNNLKNLLSQSLPNYFFILKPFYSITVNSNENNKLLVSNDSTVLSFYDSEKQINEFYNNNYLSSFSHIELATSEIRILFELSDIDISSSIFKYEDNVYYISLKNIQGLSQNTYLFDDKIEINFIKFSNKNIKKLDVYCPNNLILDTIKDFEYKLVKLNEKDSNKVLIYNLQFISGSYTNIGNVLSFDIQYKSYYSKENESYLHLINDNELVYNVYDYMFRIYLRPNIDLLANISIENKNRDGNNIIVLPINSIYDNLNSKIKYIEYIENNLTNSLYNNDFIDVLDFNQYIYSIKNNNTNGIIEEGLYRNLVEIQPLVTKRMYARHTNESGTITGFHYIGKNGLCPNTNLNDQSSYPIHELQIDNGKYNETSFKKLFIEKLKSVNQKIYDNKKGIFNEDINKNMSRELLNITKYNNGTTFSIDFNRSIGSMVIKQFSKVFEANRSNSDFDVRYVYYNNGLPYLYFQIPEVSLPNNSIIYIQGTSSLDNVPTNDIIGTKKIIIPNKYRISIRQLSPLPDPSYIDNNKYLYQNNGYSRVENEYTNNEYEDYINSAISDKNINNKDYIIKNIKRIKQELIDNSYFGLENITKINNEFDILEKNINSINQHKFNLKKSYINNYGNNQFYEQEDNYDNLGKISKVYSNRNPYEYYGQSLINSQDNEVLYRQTQFVDDITTINSGIQSAFYENELFMKLSDLNNSYNKTMSGKIVNLEKNANSNGNHVIDYDLFVEERNNFRIGDIIIGLDSGAIAIILPDDYKFNNLPNDDLITLGLGYYIVNMHYNNKPEILNYFLSTSNSITDSKSYTKNFIKQYQYWTPQRINTSSGFYIRTSTSPNISRLGGIATSNLSIFIPSYFKFLEGEDTPLSSFGYKDSVINNEFNYFKDNFSNTFDTEIKWSYIINNEIDSKQYLILETKNIDNFSVQDEIYIRNHSIINKDVDYRKEIFFNSNSLVPFNNYIAKFETIYNKLMTENIGNSYFINKFKKDKLIFEDSRFSIINTRDTSVYFLDDKSSIDSNYTRCDILSNNVIVGNVGILYYSNNFGELTNIYTTDISNVNLMNDNTIIIKNSEQNIELDFNKLEISSLDNLINKTKNGIHYKQDNLLDPSISLDKIPFKNKYITINYSQDFDDYQTSYTLKYTNDITEFNENKGEYFNISFKNENYINIIEAINIYNDTSSNYNNLIDKYIYTDVNGNQYLNNKYKNQTITLTIKNISNISIIYNLKELVFENNGSLINKVVFIKPGDDYFNDFTLVNNRTYNISLDIKRQFTTFSQYDKIQIIDNINIGKTDVELYVPGLFIDNILLDDIDDIIVNNGSDFDNVNNLEQKKVYFNNLDNISIAGLNNITNSDKFLLKSYEVMKSIDISNLNLGIYNSKSKYTYKFNLTVNNPNVILDGKTEFTITNSGSTEVKTIPAPDSNVYNYRVLLSNNRVSNKNIEPLSLFYRVVQSYINNNTIRNLSKSLELNNKYSKSLYSSRIIKIKVCPIDNKGFSFEPNLVNLSSAQTNSIESPVRSVPGYNKLLFPYHEYNVVKNYNNNIYGQNLDVNSNIIKRYTRVKQDLNSVNTKTTYLSRNFLPGMGISAIKETIYPTYVLSSSEADFEAQPVSLPSTDSPTQNTKLINTLYEYESKFIGYVLNTSIESVQEDRQSYRLNSNNFSKEGSDEIYSEYYLYVLLDPTITTRSGIDEIFDTLNNDYVHYVFDGSANQSYGYENPLISNGYLNNGDQYSSTYNSTLKKFILDESTTGKTVLTPETYTAFNPKNIYGQRVVRSDSGATAIYDDYRRNKFLDQNIVRSGVEYDFDVVPDSRNAAGILSATEGAKNLYPYLDQLQENLIGCITILKDKLNYTLPNYQYNNRIACATQVERPVFIKKSNNPVIDNNNTLKSYNNFNEKLFIDGSLDLFYQEQLKNKCVMNYTPIKESNDFKLANEHNIIIEDKKNLNTEINNNSECNVHSNILKQYSDTDFNYNLNKVSSKIVDGVEDQYTFEPDTDLVLINSKKKVYGYSNGPNYQDYLGTANPGDTTFNTIGYSKTPIKVLSGRILPSVDFSDVKLSYLDEYKDLTKNWCLLDKEYTEDLNLLSKNGTYGKYKTNRIDILGNNSDLYNYNTDTDNVFCEIKNVIEIGNYYISDNEIYGYIIASYDSLNLYELENDVYLEEVQDGIYKQLKLLEEKMLILSGYQQDKETRIPFNIPQNTELAIIDTADVIGEDTLFNIPTLNEQYKIETINKQYSEKVIYIRFKNRIKNKHKTTQESNEQSRYYITYQTFKTTKEIEKLTDLDKKQLLLTDKEAILPYIEEDIYKLTMTSKNIKYLTKFDSINNLDGSYVNKYIDNIENYIIDYGNKRNIEITDGNKTPYNININYPEKESSSFIKSLLIKFVDTKGNILVNSNLLNKEDITNGFINNKNYNYSDISHIELYIVHSSTNVLSIIYPKDTFVVLQKNSLIKSSSINDESSQYYPYQDKLPYSNVGTQPFLFNNEWYTKIYYRSPYNNIETIISSLGKSKSIINNIDNNSSLSELYNIYNRKKLYIASMKGINIPFVDLHLNNNNEINDINNQLGPIEDGNYDSYTRNIIPDFNTNEINIDSYVFEGKFVKKLDSLLFKNKYSWEYIKGLENINLNYFVVKGLYNGFGGIFEERFDDNLVKTIINNDFSGRVARLKTINNKFFMFVELDTYKNPLSFSSDENIENTNFMNQAGRSDSLNFNIFLSLLENNLTNSSKISDVQNKLTLYGKEGRVSKKKINNPYNLNPNNYVYLVIPVFDNIELVQNNSLQGAFAKILLPGESNKTLFNTYTSSSKIFNHSLYNNLTELEIAFVTNDGYLFDFNGAEHSFSLEITEIIDKFEYINPKFGNIEF